MNYIYTKSIRTILAALILVLAGWISLPASAQDPVETVLKYGPNPDAVRVDSIEFALESWVWQSKLIQTQMQKIEETGQRARQELDNMNEELLALRKNLASVGASFPIDASSVQQIETELFDLESTLVGLRSKAVLLQEQTALDRRQRELEVLSKQGELDLLQRELDIRREEMNRVKQLRQTGSISTQELAKVEATLVETEVKLQKVRGELKIVTDLVEQSQLQVEMRSVAEETRLIEERFKRLQDKLDRINSTGAIHKYEALMFRMDMARRMMQLSQTRQLELELENTRNLALIELTTEALERWERENTENEDQDDDQAELMPDN